MANPVRDSVKDNVTGQIEKAKAEGRNRAENIREIVKNAVMQAVSELKEGSGEIGIIVKEAIGGVIADLKGNQKELGQAETNAQIGASIEGAIAGSTYHRQEAIAQRQAKLSELQAILDQQQQELDQEIEKALIDINADVMEEDSAEIPALKEMNLKEINLKQVSKGINLEVNRNQLGILSGQYLNLKSRLTEIDQKLMNRYGDRYGEIKQQLEKQVELGKDWYEHQKALAQTSGTIPLLEKQEQVEEKLSNFGSFVAKKEQEIIQNIQKLWK